MKNNNMKNDSTKNNKTNNKEKSKESGLFPGSFSPFHNGHLEVIKESLNEFSKVEILIVNNPTKLNNITVDERKELVEAILKDSLTEKELRKIEVTSSNKKMNIGEYAWEKHHTFIIRGIRWFEKKYNREVPKDEEYLFNFYQEDNPRLSINYIVSDLDISSTKIIELIRSYKSINDFVNPTYKKEIEAIWMKRS